MLLRSNFSSPATQHGILQTVDQDLPYFKWFKIHIRQKLHKKRGWETLWTADVQNKAARRAPQRNGFKKIFERGEREECESEQGVCSVINEPLDIFSAPS